MSKTKEMIVDYRKMRAEHAPIHTDRAEVKWVEGFKFFGVHITNKQIIMVQTHQESCEEGTFQSV